MSAGFEVVGAESEPAVDADLEIRPEEMGLAPAEPTEGNDEPVQVEAGTEPEAPAADSGVSASDDGASGVPEPEHAPQEKEEEAPAAEAEPEPVAAAEPEPEPEQPQSVTVPKARLDKALRDKRMLEQQLQQYQQQPAAPAPDDKADAASQLPVETQSEDLPSNKEIAEALLDGDLDKYSEMMAKRDAIRDQKLIQQVTQTVPQQLTEQQNRQAFTDVRVDLETKYEFLDSNSENFDPEITETIIGFSGAYQRQGYTAADSLQMATEKVLKVEKPELFHVEQSTPAPNPKVDKVKQERMNIDQKIAAAAAQPPRVQSGDVSEVNSVPDFATMSDEEFDKYTPEQVDAYMQKMRESRFT
ncbi:hypothetical protein [Endozoicomonas ascidiicola]|uniref:hypothetical protein n=1 Tax=Endozoicomonas ascidiicola TaxID=1698521 RepID=UPI000834C725|nr:hypothetical protein [Endozoicomonas ascidiicola]